MEGNFKPYDWVSSSLRIKEVLDQPAGQFVETDDLPSRDRLTFTNGFYGRCSAIFVDIRNSSGLPQKYRRPTLAKIYRAFISEMVAVLNSDLYVREVNIVGDCVWAVYNTPSTSDINDVFRVAFTANTVCNLLNCRFRKKDIGDLNIGIGVDFGRVLMVKAGYSGSGINDVVYMGDVVNRAAHLAHEAGRGWAHPIWVGPDLQCNLNDHNQSLLTQRYHQGIGSVYTGDVVRTDMNEWVEENC